MRMRTKLIPFIGIVALAVTLAGCGGSSASPVGTGGNNTSTDPVATATTAPPAASDLPIATASVSVKGTTTTILTNAAGLTIYYRTSDSGTNVFVGGSWPPILASNGAPTSKGSLPGSLAMLQDNNGAQVTYNGHPLYLYAGDSKAGDTNGEGLGNVWFVVTPDIAKAANTSGTGPTPTAPPYGYNH
jgi:predicted lipoprotein with Yx(FWY)xxD motif